MRNKLLMLAVGLAFTNVAFAGPFAPAAGKPGSTAVFKDDVSIVGWATGYQDYVPGTDLVDQWKTPEKALGKADGGPYDIVSLGNGGMITLTFAQAIGNGAGADFAVFENSFSDSFLELGFVEVSSDGSNFFRFSTISFTPSPVGAFGSVDPTNIDGFAGKYRGGYGTAFDLELMKDIAGLDINNVGYIRIVDVLGNGTELDDFPTEYGPRNPIYDPYKTVQSAGFDLDAIGVLNYAQVVAVPEPESYAMLLAGLGMIAFTARRRKQG